MSRSRLVEYDAGHPGEWRTDHRTEDDRASPQCSELSEHTTRILQDRPFQYREENLDPASDGHPCVAILTIGAWSRHSVRSSWRWRCRRRCGDRWFWNGKPVGSQQRT